MDIFNQIISAIREDDLAKLKEVWDADVANSTRMTSVAHTGFYALHFAIIGGRGRAVKYMIENGADPNVKTHGPETTPIRGAIQWWMVPAFSSLMLLLKHGANPYIKNKYGHDAFTPEKISYEPGLCCLESYLVVELVTGEADNLFLDVWRVVKSFLYKI